MTRQRSAGDLASRNKYGLPRSVSVMVSATAKTMMSRSDAHHTQSMQASQQHQLNLSAAAVAAAAQQVSLEHQQNVEKEASAMLKNEVSITTANSANKDKNEKEAPLVIGKSFTFMYLE